MFSTRRVAGTIAGGLALTWSMTLAALPALAQSAGPNVATTTPIISTIAGTGQAGFSGDGGSATAAKLSGPTGFVEDIAGNIYLADSNNNRVRRIASNGNITTVAGNGSYGFAGDGGAAKNARLAFPTGVAVDGSGNLYVADTGNNRIRKVTPAGTITTIAGSGPTFGLFGLPLMPTIELALLRLGCSLRGNGGPATTATLCLPTGVAVDAANNVFIADTGNNEVRRVTAGTITAFAGNGTTGSSGDGGPATAARLHTPAGVSLDSLHNVFIADTQNNKVRKVNSSGVITTFAGTGGAGHAGDGGKAILGQLNAPTGLGIDAVGNVYISDTLNCRIRVVIPKGDILTYAGTGVCGYSGDGGPATAARVNEPAGSIAVDANNVYFGDNDNNRGRGVHGGPPPNISEVPYLVVLPLSALVVLGGAYLIVRRRRGSNAQPAQFEPGMDVSA
jgi:hypothetical protein